MNSQTFEERSIKLSGLITKDYCILASISNTPLRNGTVWTNENSTLSTVITKNHNRLSDEETQISITSTPDNAESSVKTSATAMFEVTSADDHYLGTHRVTYKEFTYIGPNQWNATVYGTPLRKETPEIKIDPYVKLTDNQFFLSARVNDTVKDQGNVRITEKRHIKTGNNTYINEIITPTKRYSNNVSITQDDMFRTLAADDIYIDEQAAEWRVKVKWVFYLLTMGGVDFYGREILLIKV
ncbi:MULTISPECIES: hypothetical protein [unclassified Pseudomonas]|uniref:hypothetical protein n=1 Tax=unclassified Pseudomonas TaxID=196821 RepID=UPI000CD10E13|nr:MULTISPECIES: hypothetical protein [unclassified Pseudomonas]POA26192.1 hypothetical protein C1887_28955 [Pseudomonas sp. GW456-R21]POA60901.1 hypothetical protein C1884_29085 [Pseudomonas sp. GW460-R15]